MELDQIKSELNLRMNASQQERSATDIASMLKKDTVFVVRQIRRSLWIELGFAIAFTALCVIMALYSTAWVYKTYFSIFIFVGVAFIGLLGMLLQKARKPDHSGPVKANLGALISLLKAYVKRYLQLGMALLPLCFILACWLSYNDPANIAKPFRWNLLIYLLAYLAIFGTVMYYFTKWYLQKLYGNYIRQLEALLEELEA